jgi:hypothetical protein
LSVRRFDRRKGVRRLIDRRKGVRRRIDRRKGVRRFDRKRYKKPVKD